ncbi:hypothetical protein GCM10009613_14440 [Pseudonocardia kongjuensis]|uniref:Oxaloacetate decarboxylase n=1 Tax=Pseudonocardia kongjuensis TaxID=102227 RepID=A0ABN1XKQ0_9PSEU
MTPRFPPPLPTPGATPLAARLRSLAAQAPDAPLVSDGDTVLTRAGFDARTNRLARAFADRGVAHGDLVSIALPNTVHHLECSVAAWKLGAVPQPLSARLPAAERDAVLAVARPALVVDAGPADLTGFDDGPLPDVVGPSWKAPTSGGSTGRPKLIVAGQAACVEQVLARVDGLRIDRDGVLLCTAPLHHNAPYMFSLMALLQGHHVVLMQRFDAARALSLVGEHGVTWLYVVPTMMGRMLRLPAADWAAADLRSLRTVLHVGAPCPPQVKRGWLERVPPETVLEIYAGTESQAGTAIDGREWLARPGSVGRVVRGRITVRDDDFRELPPGRTGEIWMRPDGPPTYHYLGAAARERDGWESLGDMGSFDADGYLYLADRRADMILVGGANVYPAEVEAALLAHPEVRDAVVVGLPDDDYGRIVHAVVQADRTAGLADRLRTHMAALLGPPKLPRSYEFVDRPLRDDAGKVRRSAFAPAGHRREDRAMTDLLGRLRDMQVSSLCDADKSFPVVDPAIRSLVPGVTMVGPAVTVSCVDDHLPMFAALRAAAPGSVLVVAGSGGTRAVAGELFANEAKRRGLAGIVVDGLVRDLRGLRSIGFPVFARGTCPASGSTRDPGTVDEPVSFGGIVVGPGDIVCGDDDGLLIAAPDRLAAVIDTAEGIEAAERALVSAMRNGHDLHSLTTVDDHVAALGRGEDSALGFRV